MSQVQEREPDEAGGSAPTRTGVARRTGGNRTDPYVAVKETHAGVVVLLGDYAYKIKKPVDLGFLDFRERRTRLRVCRHELELNRRLAPDVYLDVADVRDAHGRPTEHVLVMRRMPAERSLAQLVREGAPLDAVVREVASILAEFHVGGRRSAEIAAEGTAEKLRARWDDNLETARRFTNLLPAAELAELRRRAHEFLDERARLLHDRAAAGRIVDGHGDLLAEDIFCLHDGPRVLDCIEFDDRLRYLDGLDDAACLAMDLEYQGATELGNTFLNAYRKFAADPAPAPLAHHYIAYRALVRAKVACLKYTPRAQETAENARNHLRIALDHARRSDAALVLVGGLPGTGKSTLATRLAHELDAQLVASDDVRKELAGLAPGEPAPDAFRSGLYAREHTERTYDELAERARKWLVEGHTVVLDASWNEQRYRVLAAEAAQRAGTALVAFRCSAPLAVTEQRLRDRQASRSDADVTIAARLAADTEPWPEAIEIDTTVSPARASATALNHLRRTCHPERTR